MDGGSAYIMLGPRIDTSGGTGPESPARLNKQRRHAAENESRPGRKATVTVASRAARRGHTKRKVPPGSHFEAIRTKAKISSAPPRNREGATIFLRSSL